MEIVVGKLNYKIRTDVQDAVAEALYTIKNTVDKAGINTSGVVSFRIPEDRERYVFLSECAANTILADLPI